MSVIDAALSYGARAIPLHAPDAFPRGDKSNGKAPNVGKRWPDWSATPAAIRRHYARHPDDNVGIRTGDGLVVLDVDPRHGGDATLAGLEREHGPLPDTREVVTGGNGRHLYFAGDAAPWSDGGLELKGKGCQVCAPPSVHPDPPGRLYVWHPGRADTLAPLPTWLVRGAPVAPTVVRERADDELSFPMTDVIEALTGRRPNWQGYVQCPFHKNGEEGDPSLKLYGETWACFACPPRPGAGRRHLGGGALTFAALLWDFPTPLRGAAFLVVQARMLDCLLAHYERRTAA